MDVEALRTTVVDDPTNVKAFQSLQEALITQRRLGELKEIYELVFPAVQDTPEQDRILRVVDQQARSVPDEDIKKWLNYQLGELFWKQLGNPDRAEVYFRRLQDAAGQGGLVGEFYTEFYARRDNWRRLEQLYAQMGLEPIEVKRKLAEVAESKGRNDKALTFWQGVYNEDPSDESVFQRLEQLYAEVGKWHSLVDLLKKKQEAAKEAGDVQGQVDVILRTIAIHDEHIKSDTKVIRAWQAILELQPENIQALDALQAVYVKMKRWPDLARVLQTRVKSVEDPEQQLKLHRQLATLMLERFSNSSEAIKHFEAILELDPADLESLRAVKGLYEQRKSWEEFVGVSQKEIALTQDTPEARTTALIELAALASERIRHPRIATRLWEDILENDPGNGEALQQLQSLYEREKSWEKLVDVLEALVEREDDDAERLKILEKLGQIVGGRLKDDEKTVGVWKRVLEIDRDNRRAFSEMRKRALASLDLEALEWLFRTFGSLGDLIRALEGQVKDQDDAKKVALQQKIADLYLEDGNTAKAVSSLESVLAIEPDNAEAARRLIPIYSELERWDALPDVYEVVIDATEEDERSELLVAQATIQEEKLQDLDAAFFTYVSAFQLDHTSGTIRAEFDRLAEASGNWETWVGVVEQMLELIEDPAEARPTMLALADVYHQHLGQHDQALGFYTRVVAEEEDNRRALDAIEQIYRETEQWEDLISALHTKQRVLSMPEDEEKAVLLEIGAVWRDRMDDSEAAMDVYRDMTQRFPDDLRIYDELAHLYLQAEEYAQLSEVLGRKLRTLSDRADASAEDLSDLQCKLGQLAYAQSADTPRAVDHYIDALDADPGCGLAVRSLEELLAEDTQRERIALALESVYTAGNKHRKLADVLEIQLMTAGDEAQRKALLSRIADLYQHHTGDNERALWAASRLFQIEPEDTEHHARIDALAEDLGEFAHLADLYEDHLGLIETDSVRLALLQKVAQTAQNHLDDAERAERVYGDLLELEPLHAETLDALEYLYLETDQPEKLLGVLRKKETLTESDEEVIDLRFQTAALLADQLDRVEDAISDVREVLAIQPEHEDALAHLDDLYGRSEQWEDLHDVLKQRVRLAGSDMGRASLLVRLAELRETRLDSVEDAIETYAEILQIDVQHPDAKLALERLFDNEELAPSVAPILEPTYKESGAWEGLVRVYEVMEQTADEPERKVELHYAMAALHEEQGMAADRAFHHYGESYRLLPEQDSTIARLLRLSDVLENPQALADLLTERVEDVGDPDRRREIHRTVAQLLRDKCEDNAGAIANYRAVLDITPEDLKAVDSLAALYRTGEDWEHLVEVLRTRAMLAEDEAERLELLLEAGGIAAEGMGDAAEAISVYEEVRAMAPGEIRALDALAELYESTDDHASLCGVLAHKISQTAEMEERKDIARELAMVQEAALEDLDAAIDTHRLILGWDPSDVQELLSLDDLLTRQERWMDLIEVLDQRIELSTDEDARALKRRKASIWRDKLEDTVQAIGELADVLGDDMSDAEAMDALESIVRETDEREGAFAVLEAFLELGEQWPRIYQLLDVLVENREDLDGKIEGLHKMGEIAETQLGDAEMAFGCYGRAVQENLEHAGSMEQVERLASEHGLWERLCMLLADGATGSDDPRRAVALRLRSAEILKTEIGDLDRSITTYRQVLDDEPENLPALAALDQLYQATERWTELAGVIRTQSDLAQEEEERVGLFFRLADVAEHKLDDADTPFQCYQEVFFLQPDNAETIEQLERLARDGSHRIDIAALLEPMYVERQHWDRLHEMLELRLEVTDDPIDKLDLQKRLAQVNLENLGKKSEAIFWFGQAFRGDPMDDGLLDTMETLAAETEGWAPLKEVLLAVAIGIDDGERKILLWHKGARIMRDHLMDAEQAEMIYKFILQEDGGDAPALSALDELYTQQERWPELYAVLENLAEAVEFEDDRSALLLRIGALLRDRLEDDQEAIGAYGRVLDINDSQPEALDALNALYRKHEKWTELAGVLRQQTDLASVDVERLAFLRDLAGITEHQLGDAEGAIELWEDVCNYSPNDVDAVRNMRRLQEDAGNFESVVEAIERELQVLQGADTERSVALYRDLGRIWGDNLEDPLQAQEAWTRLLDLEDNDIEAMRSLEEIHEEASNFEALARIRQRMVDSLQFEGDELLQLYRKLARLWTDPLPESERAIWAWSRVRELAEDDFEAVEALEQLYTDEGRYPDAVGIMTVKAGMVEDEKAIVTWLALGEIQQFQLEDWEAAAGSYGKVMELQRDHSDASERLESIFSANERFEELAEVLQARTEVLVDIEEKREVYTRLADLYENRLEESSVALLYLEAAHLEAPGDLDLLSGIERVATRVENWDTLYEQYQIAIDAFDDNEDKIDFGLRSARLLRDKLHNLEGGEDRLGDAVTEFRDILALDGEHDDALRELSVLLERQEDWEALVAIAEKRFVLVTDGFERAEIGLGIGQILSDKIGDVDRSVAAYRQVLDTGEADERSIAALEAIFGTNERWADLIDLLETKAGNGLGDETQIRLEIARIKEQKLDDPQGAIAVYEEILDIDDTQRDALHRLEDLYGREDQMDKLSSVYERLLHVADTDEEQVDLCRKVALLQRAVHENPEAAADYYHRALAINPTDAESLDALEDIYGELEQFEDLIDVYRRRLDQVDDDVQWAELKERAARLYHERLDDPDNAIYAYQELIERVPGNKPALDALEALFRATDQPEQVQDILAKKAEVADNEHEIVSLLCQRAEIMLDSLSDPDGALGVVNRALSTQADNKIALGLLERIYISRGEWDNVIEALRKRDLYLTEDADKAAVQARIAAVYRDNLSDGMKAVEHYERALQLEPDDVSVAEPLAELYVAAEDWIKAESLLRMIADKAEEGEGTDEQRAETFYNLGRALQACLRPDEALTQYDKSLALRPGDMDVLKALGKLAYETGDYDRAESIYSKMIDELGVDADDAVLVDLYKTLGQIAFKSGKSEKALDYLEKTAALQPGNIETLEALISLCEEQRYWQGVIDYATELRELKTDDVARFELQVRIGDVYLKHMEDPHSAVSAYKSALDYRRNKAAYLKIFTTLVEAEIYEEAIETLDELVEMEQDAKRKAQYLGAAGDIFREKLEDNDRAVEFYNRALDHDSSLLKLFRAIDEVLTRGKDWNALQKNYRRMLARVQVDDTQIQLQHKLAFYLGEIFRSRLKAPEKAKAAFDLARTIKPNDVKTLDILSQLYEADEEFEAAVEVERLLLQLNPGKIDHYRNLKRLYFDSGDQDSAWVACSVLYLLGQANEREEEFYKDHAPALMAEDAQTPEGDVWAAALFSKDEDLLIGSVLLDVYQGIGENLTTTTLKTLKLKKKNEVDINGKEQFSHVYRECVRVLGLNPPPAVYHLAGSSGLIIRDTVPPIITIGDDLRQGRTEQELAFVISKALTYFHPLHLAVCVAASGTLDSLVKASLKMFVEGYDAGKLEGHEGFTSILDALTEMSPQLQQSLGKHIQGLLAHGEEPNITRWLNQIELTANHAALLMANDPVMAARFVKQEKHRPMFTAPGRLSTRDKLVDLAIYALSQEYLELRRALGVRVEID